MSINTVAISGNLGRDPELRATASGTQVCSFSVCVNGRRQNQQGEWEDVPNWVDVTFFGKRAESIELYLSKGSLVFVKGKLHQNRWQDKNGNNRSKLEVIGEDIHFGGGNQQSHTEQQGYQSPQGYQYKNDQQPAPQPEYGYQEQIPEYGGVYDEDIPF
ncbi:MAG: single-stranded DNA-binding protein [Coriobacteriaceae bacterium]|uniref:single-stranded DNA-binding protein n=1 Tax=Tractidigestivibacter sp. TaxID=2847320 RepID=UPI002A7F39E0|nr:single-stranded DNA-binding protein [Tractidigestivibacter sp.]MCI6274405.1 single-stranded DNA-binding protein [Coriobacteriaceae bacterium]MCI6844458.1 single-stranded DNA-binding protein [Coriobacteriaceae bacterium]MDY4535463.1 single-stranded DNA-binding protein [Tractidigestivibacter sp.]MDY5272152.1 single-stranded DNA-binding protein [Tractidigestivibacter sp.]